MLHYFVSVAWIHLHQESQGTEKGVQPEFWASHVVVAMAAIQKVIAALLVYIYETILTETL